MGSFATFGLTMLTAVIAYGFTYRIRDATMVFYADVLKHNHSIKLDSSKGENNGQKQILGDSPQGPCI